MMLLLLLLGLRSLLAPVPGRAQARLYLDLQLGANHTFAEGAYTGKGTRPFKAYSNLNFSEQAGGLLRLQLSEKVGFAAGYSGSNLGWAYSLKVPQQLTEQADPAVLYQQVEQEVTTYVLPYLDRVDRLDTILQQLVQERNPNSALAVKTLYVYGYQQQAWAWVAEEIASTLYRGHRQQMRLAQAEFDTLV